MLEDKISIRVVKQRPTGEQILLEMDVKTDCMKLATYGHYFTLDDKTIEFDVTMETKIKDN